MSSKKQGLFVAIDANAIVHRAFHAYPPTLATQDGLQVNAVYGFTSMFLEVLNKFQPRYVVCAFDTAKPTFRHSEFTEYKANRKPTDQSLIAQFPLVENIVEAMNVPILKLEGFEADDILGTIARMVREHRFADPNLELYIVSGDRDLLQLVGGNVKVVLPEGGFKNLKIFDEKGVVEKMKVLPSQIVDYKALVGDTSDNIPGVKGVGKKSAENLLAQYKTLDGIYQHLPEIKGRVRTLLEEGIDNASMSRKLARIDQNVPLSLSLDSCVLKDFDKSRIIKEFKRFGFKSLINKLPSTLAEDVEAGDLQAQTSLFGELNGNNNVIVEDKRERVLTLKELDTLHVEKLVWLGEGRGSNDVSFLCVDNSGQFVGNLPVDLGRCFTDLAPRETSLTVYVVDVSRGLKLLHSCENKSQISQMLKVAEFLSANENSARSDFSIESLLFDYVQDYNGAMSFESLTTQEQTDLSIKLVDEISARLESRSIDMEFLNGWVDVGMVKGFSVADTISFLENFVAIIIGGMEARGIAIDYSYLLELQKDFESKVEQIKHKVFELIGHEINLNSPRQLAEFLYDEIHLPNRTRTTRESVLRQFKTAHPAIPLILQYREIFKLKSTYIDSFIKLAKKNKEDKYWTIHTTYDQIGTSSGRFASRNPNMQNLPATGEYAQRIKAIFTAREGFSLVSIDYSQIELRIMAYLSQDQRLIQDFIDGKDIHRSTTSSVLKVAYDKVTKEQRRIGKIINFAMIYGQTPYGLASQLKISKEEAAEYIQSYFENYAGVHSYIEQQQRDALQNGWVQTFLGRRRYIPGLKSQNKRVQAAAFREAINMPIQGGAADVMKLAMISLFRLITQKYKGKAFLLLQIHDEFVFEVKDEVLDDFVKDAKLMMEGVVTLDVPLKVGVEVGKRLGE